MKKIFKIFFPTEEGSTYTSFRYPAGEVQVRLTKYAMEMIAYAEEIYVISRIHDGEVMELAQLLDAIQGFTFGKHKVSLILPYLPYSRADRRFTMGDSWGVEVFSRILRIMPVDAIYTLDVHSDYTKGDIYNVSARPFIEKALDHLGRQGTLLLFPDKGAADRYTLRDLAPIAYAMKNRNPVSGVLEGFTVPGVSGYKNVLIVDDICDGGGTFLGIAKELPEANLSLYVTHGIFSKGFDELSKAFKNIYTTDSMYEHIFPYSYVRMFSCLPTMYEAMEKL